MTDFEHFAEVNRLQDLDLSLAGNASLALSTRAQCSGYEVTVEQMEVLSRCRSVQAGMNLAREFWGRDFTERIRARVASRAAGLLA